MKRIVALFTAVLLVCSVSAQEKWTIKLNDRVVLRDSVEEVEKNIVRIKRSDLKKKKEFQVLFYENNSKKEWDRYLAIFDSNEEELVQKDGTKLKISNARLQALFKKSKKLTVYTWMLPTDPDLRSRIRIRRIHLCTLVLE